MPRSNKRAVFAALLTAAFLVTAGAFTTSFAGVGDGDKPAVCHPVNGAGQTGYGWNIISPDQASSHIDESLYPDGIYWKHTSNDGRHDVYAVNGVCPGAPTTTTTTTTTSTTLAPTTTTTEPTTTQPTVPPTDPTVPPTDPTVPPTDPTLPPTDPTVPPTQPAVPPTQPSAVSPANEESSGVPPTLAPPLGQIPETGSSAIAPISVIAGSLLLSGALAVAATRRRPIR